MKAAPPSPEEYAAAMGSECAAVSLANIGRMLAAAVEDADGEFRTFVPREGPERQSKSFELKVSASGLFIREHSDGWREYRFEPFAEWARDNGNYLTSIHERIASSIVEG